tara:strand:+ start:464 stop:676 length:213 start_codon:yes stop_codon:yes gene_type:complete
MFDEVDMQHDQIAVALTYEPAAHQVFLAPWLAREMSADAVARYLTAAIEVLGGIRDDFEMLADHENGTIH